MDSNFYTAFGILRNNAGLGVADNESNFSCLHFNEQTSWLDGKILSCNDSGFYNFGIGNIFGHRYFDAEEKN